ncbi:hypothetical protein EDB92DRAFT_1819024 [Lactarius akahatsu]|uniref:Uncharacterized protein n=1 Tax=Lactarius akahatsu TaxID=416441 RepID=A0AAD4LCR8_9AGAM|nr:hypothetical protein EDB92DRAFT_1819024 [Lactarius akahatsu]
MDGITNTRQCGFAWGYGAPRMDHPSLPNMVSALCACAACCAVCPALYVGSLGCLVIRILVITAQRASNRVNKPTQTIVVQLVLRHNALWRIPIPVSNKRSTVGSIPRGKRDKPWRWLLGFVKQCRLPLFRWSGIQLLLWWSLVSNATTGLGAVRTLDSGHQLVPIGGVFRCLAKGEK